MDVKIPAYTAPAHLWVRKVRMVLNSKRIDVKHEDSVKHVGPIIARLPSEIFELVSEDVTLQALLQFIESFDKPKSDLPSFIAAHKSHTRPSHEISHVRDGLSNAMPSLNKDELEEMAWQTVLNGFPETLKQMCKVMDINKAPTAEQIVKIDDLWQSHNNASVSNVCGVNHNANSPETNEVLKRLVERLETVETQLSRLNSARSNDSQRNPYTTPRNNNFSQNYHPRNNNLSQNRQRTTYSTPNTTFPDRNQNVRNNLAQAQQNPTNGLCYFHQSFGVNARRCVPPCNFHTSNQQTQQPNNNRSSGEGYRAPSRY